MDVQRSVGSLANRIWPWSCDVFVLNFLTEDNRSFVEDLRNALYRKVIFFRRDQPMVICNMVKKYGNSILFGKRYWKSSLNHVEEFAKEINKSGQIATVGIGYRHVEKLIDLLDLGSKDDVRVVGISGMGGVGKSALARDVLNKISHLFDLPISSFHQLPTKFISQINSF
ncbi:uncharacterized protein LOC129321974 [Prosopis cineraria]|uniref:uncharacterized protein LOC129321974 n=1 Tax=Prosopis cineraria TaxID=364024 RepID=UPI00240F9603|nr:uncharacterized protein LOC129321974 [Prosopis cineraria]